MLAHREARRGRFWRSSSSGKTLAPWQFPLQPPNRPGQTPFESRDAIEVYVNSRAALIANAAEPEIDRISAQIAEDIRIKVGLDPNATVVRSSKDAIDRLQQVNNVGAWFTTALRVTKKPIINNHPVLELIGVKQLYFSSAY